jgi:hypothetical protein
MKMKMDMTTFVTQAARTMPAPGAFHISDPKQLNLLHGAIGLCTEVGEIWECLQSEPFDRVNMGEEIGDALWYIGILCRELGIALPDEPNLDDTPFDRNTSTLEQVTGRLTSFSTDILDCTKKTGFYNSVLNVDKMVSHTQLTYTLLGQLCYLLQLDINEIRFNNNAKLRVRFPTAFTEDLAQNRDLDKERNTLEN